MIINDENYSGSAVYRIRNITNNKIYIGSTSNYKQRIHAHWLDLKNNRHANKGLQDDFNNKHEFVTEILRKYKIKFKHELFYRERDYIKEAKRNNQELYNVAKMEGTYYVPRSVLLHEMADLYAKEHFGLRVGHFSKMPPAKVEMYYKLLSAKSPEEEKAIREEYEPLIDYQNKKEYYKLYCKLDYDDLLELPPDERRRVIREALDKNKHKTA